MSGRITSPVIVADDGYDASHKGNDDEGVVVGLTKLPNRQSSQEMAAQVVIAADAAEQLRDNSRKSLGSMGEEGGLVDDILKQKEKEISYSKEEMMVEPLSKATLTTTSNGQRIIGDEQQYSSLRDVAVGLACEEEDNKEDQDKQSKQKENISAGMVVSPVLTREPSKVKKAANTTASGGSGNIAVVPPPPLDRRPSDAKQRVGVPSGMVAVPVSMDGSERSHRPSRRQSDIRASLSHQANGSSDDDDTKQKRGGIPGGMISEPVQKRNPSLDESKQKVQTAYDALGGSNMEPTAPPPLPQTRLQSETTTATIVTTPSTDGLERSETEAMAALAAQPNLSRADARTLQNQPGAMRVSPGFAASSPEESAIRQAEENLEYENEDADPETAAVTSNLVAAMTNPSAAGDTNKRADEEQDPEEIAAELVDEETDRRRLQETLEGVLKTQNAVQVVDVEAENRLKAKRQRRNMICYVIIGIILTVVIVVAVSVSVKNNQPTTAPTELPSMAPTMAPTSRLSAVEDAVLQGFGDLPPTDNENSPQSRAIDWLTYDDTTITFPIDPEDEDSQNFFNDRYAAVVLAFSTMHEYWIDNAGWLDPALSVCDGWKGLTCNDDGRIGVIDLAIQNLTGTLPTEIGVMDNLDFLFMFRNFLTGTLPTELGNLGDVDFFYLNENQFTGTLPKELAGLLDADDLFLFGNQLTGPIPESFGNLIDVNNLYLNDNQLSGSIPSSLSQLKQIKQLYLNNNALSGNIPSELGGIISMERLLLQNNELTGEVPTHLGSFLGLQVLTLQENMLTGAMPDEVCDLTDEEERIDHLKILVADCNEMFNCNCCTRCW